MSRLEELVGSGFQTVIDEIDDLKPSAVTRIVLCSGKVYFDLLKSRREAKADTVAIVRVEQLYPFPSDEYEAILRKYSNAREIVWCQEEPQNQGAGIKSGIACRRSSSEARAAVRGPRRSGGACHRHRGAARAAAEKSGDCGAAGRAAGRDLPTNHSRAGRAQTRTGS